MRRRTILAAGFLLVTGCGGATSLDEYVVALRKMWTDYTPRGEAAYMTFLAKTNATMDDLRELLGTNVSLRVDVQVELEDLNDSWVGWHGSFLGAAEAWQDAPELRRIGTSSSIVRSSLLGVTR